MLQNLKTVTKGSIVYGLGNMSVKLVGLVLIPIYTNEKFLSVSDFSIIGILDITALFLVSLLSLSLSQALTRWYWEKEYQIRQKSVFFSVLIVLVLTVIIASALFFLGSGSISMLLFDSYDFSDALMLMMGASALQIIIALLQTLMKIQQRPGLYTTTNLARLALTLILTIIFVVYYKKGINGIYEAQIYGSLAFLLLTSGYVRKNIKLKFESKLIKEMLLFSYPLILASTSGILISILDKYILNFLSTPKNVSIYILAFKMANSLKIFIIASVQMAVSPLLFQIMYKPESKRFYSKYMTYFAFIVMFFVILLSTFSYEFIRIFAQSEVYYAAFSIVPILSFGFFFGMLKDTALTGLQITKKTGIISTVTIVSTVLNVGLNYLLIPVYSAWGSAIAFLISQIFFFILILIFAQRNHHIPYELTKVIKLAFIGSILCSVQFVLNDMDLVFRIIIKVAIPVSYPFILYLFRFYDPIELQRIGESWKKWRNPSRWKKNLKNIKFDF